MDEDTRVAVVTGGGSGIGEAVAVRLADRGLRVAIVGRRAEELARVADRIIADGGAALTLSFDLAQPDAPAQVVSSAAQHFGQLDVIVNNAAYIKNYRLDELDDATFDQHVAVNLRAPLMLIKAALPWLRQSDSAAIVNVSSSSGSLSIPGQSSYGVTKAGLDYLTRSLAAELAPDGIRVNGIAPGPTDTPIHLTWARDIAEAHRALAGAVPLGRIADPDELARWVDYLVRPDERFITGAVLPVDGGQTLNGAMSDIGRAAVGRNDTSAG